jgi:alpha-beta hydrolase superfamily lysophospholipase
VSGTDSPRIAVDLLELPGADTVLLIPGFWRTRRDPVTRRIARRLGEAGLAVCVMDSRGHGDSSGTFGFNTHESDDVIRVLEELGRRSPRWASTCILGFSAGGAIALSAAARRPDLVQGLVLVSPVADFKRVLPRPNPFGLHREISLHSLVRPPRFWWYETSRRHALEDARRVLAPVLLVHAKNDWLVHHSHSERIAEQLPSSPSTCLPDLDRAHAERLLDMENAPWPTVFAFMEGALGMNCQARDERNSERSA